MNGRVETAIETAAAGDTMESDEARRLATLRAFAVATTIVAAAGFAIGAAAALLAAGDRAEIGSALVHVAIAMVFLGVGLVAYNGARSVPAGPAFLLFVASWALYLPVRALDGGARDGALTHAIFAFGTFLHAPAFLLFATAIARPRRLGGLLRTFATLFALAGAGWLASLVALEPAAAAIRPLLDLVLYQRALDFAAYFVVLMLLARAGRTAPSARIRRQLASIGIGIGIGMLPGWIAATPTALGDALSAELLPNLPLYVPFWLALPLAFAYAIVRFDLLHAGRLDARAQRVTLELLTAGSAAEVASRAVAALRDDFALRHASVWVRGAGLVPMRIGGDAEGGEAALVARALADQAPREGEGGAANPTLAYPLRYEGRVEAALCLERAAPEPWEASHHAYLARLAPPLALALHLRTLDDRVRAAAADLGALAAEVDLTTSELRTGGEGVSIAVQEVSEGSSVQSDELVRVATALAALRRSSSEIALRLGGANQSGEDTLARSREAESEVREVIDQVRRGAELLGETGERVAALRERSGQISTISVAIREVADQTGLLALNAAIEAARAGVEGRGFAVVADEVRKLAAHSAELAAEIGGIVGDARAEIARVGDAVDRVRTVVLAGAGGADRAESALHESMARVEELRGAIGGMAGLTERARGEVDGIAAAVERVADVSTQNAAAAEETAAATEQQLASLDSVAGNMAELSRLSTGLLGMLRSGSDGAAPGR